MASEVKADKVSPSTATSLQIGDASDTITIPTSATFTITDGLPVASGGTGLASYTAGDIIYATGSTTLAKLAKGTARQGIQTNSGATAPQWANSPQSLMTAAGDVLYASGANTLAKLAKGSDDEVLTLASGVPSWASAAGGGKVNQVIQTVDTTLRSTSSGTLVTTAISVTITPSATDSKVMLTWDCVIGYATGMYGQFVPYVNVGGAGIGAITTPGSLDGFRVWGQNDTATGSASTVKFSYLHSPASTSEHVYTMYWHTQTSVGYIGQLSSVTETCPTFFTAEEILA